MFKEESIYEGNTNCDDNLSEGSHQPEYLRTLRYHADTVSQIVFNPNNKQLISSSNDNSVLVWNLFNLNTKPKRLLGHKSFINDLSISPTGTLIATASSDETVRIWSNTDDFTTSPVQSQIFKHNSAPVKSVDFNSDSSLIVTGSDDKSVKIINISDKKVLANFTNAHSNWVKCVRFSKDSKLVASSSDDKTVKFWDVNKRIHVHTFDHEHNGVVNSVRFHPDNTTIATGCYDKKVRLFDVRSKHVVQIYDHHTKPVTNIAFHPLGNYLASTSYDESVKIYDLRNGQVLFTLTGHEGATTSLNFSPFGDILATGGIDSCIIMWMTNFDEDQSIDKCESNEIISPSSSKPFNGETVPYYKTKITTTTEESISEELTKVFEKMVNQLELITGTISNFDSRLTRIEEMIEDLRISN